MGKALTGSSRPTFLRAMWLSSNVRVVLRRLAFWCVFVGLCVYGVSAVQGQMEWPQLKFTHVGNSGISSPTHVTHAGDGSGRLFVVSQTGTVRIIYNDSVQTASFLNITDRVLSGVEQGLLGVAFPPDYKTKRRFYVNYTRKPDGATVISRFSVPLASPNVATASSEEILLVVPQPHVNHNGGQIAFGPDGYLYIALGDGGRPGDPDSYAQSKSSLLGKLLRIDVEGGTSPYGIPPTNPFVGDSSARPEIWALGLRNPWRFSFDRLTGDLYLSDVGEHSREEVNFQPAGSAGGQNYGWKIMEGTRPNNVPPGYDTSVLTPPVIEYDRHAGTSIIGGFVYRGPASRMSGIYFHGDFGNGRIWGLKKDGENWVSQLLETPGMRASTFGEDEQGRLYLTEYYTGRIYRVEEETSVRPPVPSPRGDIYNTVQNVTATSGTADAVIRYTINGREPTESDPVLPNSGLDITKQTNLKLRAFRAGLQPSAVVSELYRFQVASPTSFVQPIPIDPARGHDVFLQCATPDSTIRYTVDGTTPNRNSPLYPGKIHLEAGPVTVKAFAYRADFEDSSIWEHSWDKATLPKPSIGPSGGMIVISGQGTFRYTVDGAAPDEHSPVYAEPLSILGPATVRARAFKEGYHESPVAEYVIHIVNSETGGAGTLSGSNSPGYVDSEVWYQVQYRSPEGICLGANGSFYVADTGNHVIRLCMPNGATTTIAGNGTPGYIDDSGSAARFSSPRGICRDTAGNLYVADDGNHRIRKIAPDGNVTTYAGSGVPGDQDGPAAESQFRELQQLQIDAAGNIYAGSGRSIRKIDTQGNVSTIATLPEGTRLGLMLDPSGNIIASSETPKIYSVAPDGVVQVFAGTVSGYDDGQREWARFTAARGLAIDSIGIIYLCDGNYLRKIRPTGIVWTMYSYREGGGWRTSLHRELFV